MTDIKNFLKSKLTSSDNFEIVKEQDEKFKNIFYEFITFDFENKKIKWLIKTITDEKEEVIDKENFVRAIEKLCENTKK